MNDPKIRIQLLDNDLRTISDRLISQKLELQNGPTEKHKGPIRLEATLIDKVSIDELKTYLDRLTGDLPLPERKTYKKVKESDQPEEPSHIEQFLKEAKEAGDTQDNLIAYLRERNYQFVDYTYLKDFEIPIKIKKAHKKDYVFMVRRLKEAKSPKADKWDPQLAFGFIMVGAKVNTVAVYLFGKFQELLPIDWAKGSKFKLKKTDYTKFPSWMTYDERLKYSAETRMLALNPDKKPSKAYRRFQPEVEKLNRKINKGAA